MTDASAAIPRLGIPEYHWWNEGLHGVARAGFASVFPQAIGMAATWNEPLIERIGDAVGIEGRAKYNDASAHGNRNTYYGLTFWSPNINIFRDPRWGRGQETYGEDPVLTATLAGAYVRGLQGSDPHYLKVAACAKHFAVHSGPEPTRHERNVNIDERTLHEFYLYAFRALVQQDHVAGVMSAYNAVNGKPCSINPTLLHDILRREWGFDGYVVCDCGAIDDLIDFYHLANDNAHASALAVQAGVDISCLDTFGGLGDAVKQNLVAEPVLDAALKRQMRIRFRLGMFDPPGHNPYDALTIAENDTPPHAALALRAARESIVLLKNDGLLPLHKNLRHMLVVGPNAQSVPVLVGNYNGTPSHPVTILDGIRAKLGSNTQITALAGCDYVARANPDDWDLALAAARSADVVIYAGGITGELEGEAGDTMKAAGFAGGDRTAIELPAIQTDFLRALHATGTPLVYVQMSGSALAAPWEAAHLRAIIQAWYPGEQGGTAVADVLFGDYNPAGRLPVTFYASTNDLPPFEDYTLTNRTYRYFTGRPLYPFGHGLSYATFAYHDLAVSREGGVIRAWFTLENTGHRDGEEVVQLYVSRPSIDAVTPRLQLCTYRRVVLRKGERLTTEMRATTDTFAVWDSAQHRFRAATGEHTVHIGSSSADIKLRTLLTLT
ncbi:MAG: glycoside hydrolase family 3 C-terminal domain-containing protein [Candidatus Eremiobacteraeota bacterium]|nr:glycoside hydrolase family 3 C-terminal domain-containing protein [Candidatus Eremiobacteraeota bacterium]